MYKFNINYNHNHNMINGRFLHPNIYNKSTNSKNTCFEFTDGPQYYIIIE